MFKKIISLVVFTAFCFATISVQAQAPPSGGSGSANNEYLAGVYCPYLVIPDDETVFLGYVEVGNTATLTPPGTNLGGQKNWMEFTLWGGYNNQYSITTSMDLFAPGVTNANLNITGWRWDVENDGDPSVDYSVTDVQLVNWLTDMYWDGDSHICDAKAVFRCTINSMYAEPACVPANYAFVITVHAMLFEI